VSYFTLGKKNCSKDFDMHTSGVRAAARALQGDVSGRDGVVCPGPGHSCQDRSLSVRFDPTAPDGFLVHSFAGDDPIVCKDHIRERLGLERFKPNGKAQEADRGAKPSADNRVSGDLCLH
jgi:hypothetical protein